MTKMLKKFGLLFFCFLLSACARAPYRHLSFVDLPGMPAVQEAPASERKSGKLIIEPFKDYRGFENKNPKQDNCAGIANRLLFTPTHQAQCKTELIGMVSVKNDPSQKQPLINAIPEALLEDLQRRKIFDEVESVKEPLENYPGASWRLIGLITKSDQIVVYNGYLLPIVNSYIYTLGAPMGRVTFDISIEMKLEDLRSHKTVIQKRYDRLEVSQGFNMYQLDYGYKNWEVSSYQLSKTIRLLIEDFLKDVALLP